MTKQTNRLISGTMILSLSGLLVKLLNILYKLPLTNLVGVKTMGYFNTIYPTYLVLTAASLVGIPATISKLVAEEREMGNNQNAHQIFLAGFICSVILGVLVGISFIFLPFYAEIFAWEAEIRYVLWGLAIAPVLIAISGSIRGYFQGMQNMVPTAISQIIENFFKVLLGVGLVFIFRKSNLPDYVSISGATIGISLGFVLATAYLVWKYFSLRSSFLKTENNRLLKKDSRFVPKKYISKILWIAIPITISSAMVSIMGFVDTTMIYHFFTNTGSSKELARTALSSVSTTQTVINVPLAISAAVAISILPAIAVAKVHGNQKEMNDKINIALQLATKMALPSMVGIFLLAEPILSLLYREKINSELLQIYSVCMLFMILAQSVSSILQGLSGYYKTLLAVLIGVGFKGISNGILLLAGWGAKALILSSLLYFIVIFIVNFIFLRKEVNLQLDRGRIIWKPLFASLIMGVVALGSYNGVYALSHHNALSVIAAVMVAMPVYAVIMLVFKGFIADEILILPKGEKILTMLPKKWID